MKNIISTIKKLISEDVVNESFLKYLDDYNSENIETETVNSTSDPHRKQLQINHAFNELTKYYSEIFTNGVNRVIKEIETQEINHHDDFVEFIQDNYKQLLSLFNDKELTKLSQFNFDESDYDTKLMSHVMRLVKFQIQNDFVIPLIKLIENNYTTILINDCIFPIPINRLIQEINSNNLLLKILDSDQSTTIKFCPVYSELNNCRYYLSYNFFIDLSSYNSHLTKVLNEFENYSNQTIHKIKDSSEKIKIYNHIRLHIKSSLSLFSKIASSNGVVTESLQKHIRNDTHDIYNQYISESFHVSQVVKFTPNLIDFQDLQYTIAKRALVLVETKINVIKDGIKIKDEETKIIYCAPPMNLFHNKIKTKLTVPQLSYLFNCLYEEEGILEKKNKTALRQSISSCFTSKRKEDISAESIRISFNTPNEKILEFWIEKFTHMMQFAKKERENYRS